jgi:hypothetical protein
MRTHEQILGELVENGARFERAAGRVPEPLISKRLAQDEWSIKEDLCHIADIQSVGVGRIEKIMSEENPPIEIYDESRENLERDHRDDDMSSSLATFLTARADLVSKMRDRPGSDWQRAGQHPVCERFTVEFILNDMLDHEQKHFERIDRTMDRLSEFLLEKLPAEC